MTPEQARDAIVEMLGEGWDVAIDHSAHNFYGGKPRTIYQVSAWRDKLGMACWVSKALPTLNACIAAVREKYADHIAARQNPPLPDKPPEGFAFLPDGDGKPMCREPEGCECYIASNGPYEGTAVYGFVDTDHFAGRRWILVPECRKAERRRGNE